MGAEEAREDALRRHALEAGCDGLVGGLAVQKSTGQKVSAEQVRKPHGPFYCAACYSEAIHRHCSVIKDHFAHHARTSNLASPGESSLHFECKTTLHKALQQSFPQREWKCDEVVIKANQKKKLCALKPDIGGRIDGEPVALEIQSSTLTLPRLLKRSLSYSGRKIAVLWIVPLKEPLGATDFRPRLFEKFLHSMYYGRIYYWYPGLGSKVHPIHYSPAYVHIPYREWHDENGNQQVAGDYDMPYKLIKRPVCHDPIEVAEMFGRYFRNEYRPKNERQTVPPMWIMRDKLQPWWDPHESKKFMHHYPDEDVEPEE